MIGKLVSAIEWWKKEGKWLCSLICYDGVFSQIWLKPAVDLSFNIQPERYCVGYTTISSRASNTQIACEPWKTMAPCPSKAKIKKGNRCPSCYQADLVQSCLICDGTKCAAEPSFQRICEKATAYVYVASFGLNQVKVGVAHGTRIPQRWIEQGANLAKRVIVGNGIEVRRHEKAIHNALNVLSGLRTSKKVDTLWKGPNTEEIHALARMEEEITMRFPESHFYHDRLNDLSSVYSLPLLDRRPIELKVEKDLQISGKILGTKGSLLLLEIGNLPHFVDLKHLLGRKIEPKEASVITMQTALDIF
jgi:hypothetical protein